MACNPRQKPRQASIRSVTPYVPGEQPEGCGPVKLDTNENPYPPDPGVERILREMNVDGLSISIGTEQDMKALLSCLEQYIKRQDG